MDVFRCSPKTWLEESPTVLQRSETLFGAKRIKKGYITLAHDVCVNIFGNPWHLGLITFSGIPGS
jgi:hypothetical protein